MLTNYVKGIHASVTRLENRNVEVKKHKKIITESVLLTPRHLCQAVKNLREKDRVNNLGHLNHFMNVFEWYRVI
jgi:hypothetical protein